VILLRAVDDIQEKRVFLYYCETDRVEDMKLNCLFTLFILLLVINKKYLSIIYIDIPTMQYVILKS